MNLKPIRTALAFSLLCGYASAQERPQLPPPKVSFEKGAENIDKQLTDEEIERYLNIRTRPARSPITGQIVNIPVEEPKSSDLDADLCPHPSGKVKFYSPIMLDPTSGFAAYRQDFLKAQTPEIKAWVQQKLAPRYRQTINSMVSNVKNTSPKMIQEFFSEQEHLPDDLRCEHALAYYTKIGAPAGVRARLAWLTAWAYRRKVCETIEGPYVMTAVRKIISAMDKNQAAQVDLQERVNSLASFCNDNKNYNFRERQLIRIMLASYYDRLGMPGWSRSCLMSVVKAAEKQYPVGANPWMEGDDLKAIKNQETDINEVVKNLRQGIHAISSSRVIYVEKEVKYLGLATKLIREALANNEYPPEKAPFFVYLVGEFERRRENFGPAKMWLEAASQMLAATGEGDYAADQYDIMKDYVGRLGRPVSLNYADRAADRELLEKQFKVLQAATSGNREEYRTSTPPAMPTE